MNYPQRPQGGFGNDRRRDPPPPSITLDDVKFVKRDDLQSGKEINADLFDKIAQTKAKFIAEEGRGKKNKSTQLRKFYDELVMWHDKVFEHGVDHAQKYTELAPFIKMLCAKVTYAKGRDHVSEGFEKLFTYVIRAISDPETLKQAKLFIEAFMGFYKAEEKDHA